MTTNLQPPTPYEHHRFHLLDAVRGLAAILVVCSHLPRLTHQASRSDLFFGVDFFFCLSGFVIAFSYLQRLQSFLSLRDFLAARLIRLYPLLFLGVLFGIVEALAFFPSTRASGGHSLRFACLAVLQLLMLPNFGVWKVDIAFPLDFPAWCVFYELIASIGFALLVRRWRSSRRWVVVLLWLLALGLILGATHGGLLSAGAGSAPKNLLLGTVRAALSFTLGAGVFQLFRETPRPPASSAFHGVATVGIVTAVVLLFFVSLFNFMSSTLSQLATVFLLFPALVYAGALVRLPSSCTGLCAFLGNISYPLYILHASLTVPLALAPQFALLSLRHPKAGLLVLLLVLGLAIAIAHLAFKFYDVPIRKFLRDRYRAYSSAAGSSPAVFQKQGTPGDHITDSLNRPAPSSEDMQPSPHSSPMRFSRSNP